MNCTEGQTGSSLPFLPLFTVASSIRLERQNRSLNASHKAESPERTHYQRMRIPAHRFRSHTRTSWFIWTTSWRAGSSFPDTPKHAKALNIHKRELAPAESILTNTAITFDP